MNIGYFDDSRTAAVAYNLMVIEFKRRGMPYKELGVNPMAENDLAQIDIWELKPIVIKAFNRLLR